MDAEIPVLTGNLIVPTQSGFSLNRISKKVRLCCIYFSINDIIISRSRNALYVFYLYVYISTAPCSNLWLDPTNDKKKENTSNLFNFDVNFFIAFISFELQPNDGHFISFFRVHFIFWSTRSTDVYKRNHLWCVCVCARCALRLIF